MSTVKKGDVTKRPKKRFGHQTSIFRPSIMTPFKLLIIISRHPGPAAPGCWKTQGLHFRNPQLSTTALSDLCKGRKAACLNRQQQVTNPLYWKIILSLVIFKPSYLHLFQSSPGLPETLPVYPQLALALADTPQSAVPLQVCRAPPTPLCDPQSVSHTPHDPQKGAIIPPAATPLCIQSKGCKLWHSDADETFRKNPFSTND